MAAILITKYFPLYLLKARVVRSLKQHVENYTH